MVGQLLGGLRPLEPPAGPLKECGECLQTVLGLAPSQPPKSRRKPAPCRARSACRARADQVPRAWSRSCCSLERSPSTAARKSPAGHRELFQEVRSYPEKVPAVRRPGQRAMESLAPQLRALPESEDFAPARAFTETKVNRTTLLGVSAVIGPRLLNPLTGTLAHNEQVEQK